MICLGIDPGVRACGAALVERAGQRYRIVLTLTVRTERGQELSRRLERLWRTLAPLYDSAPDLVAIECQTGVLAGKTRAGQTSAAAVAVREAVGVCRTLAWERRLSVVDIEPQRAKRAVLGRGAGSARKARVLQAVSALTQGSAPPGSAHEADAVAVAIAALQEAALPEQLRRAV